MGDVLGLGEAKEALQMTFSLVRWLLGKPTVQGKITRRDKQTPVSGVLVCVDNKQQTTAQNGEFILEGLKTGVKQLDLEWNGKKARNVAQFRIKSRGSEIEIKEPILIPMEWETGLEILGPTVEGLLCDKDGNAVGEALVKFGEYFEKATALTGKYILKLPVGIYDVSVFYKGRLYPNVDTLEIQSETKQLPTLRFDCAANPDPEPAKPPPFLEIDTTPLLGEKGTILRISVEGVSTVSSLLNSIYSSISSTVKSYTYGAQWILQDANSERVFHDMGRRWANSKGHTEDHRRLGEVGILAGMKLKAAKVKTPEPLTLQKSGQDSEQKSYFSQEIEDIFEPFVKEGTEAQCKFLRMIRDSLGQQNVRVTRGEHWCGIYLTKTRDGNTSFSYLGFYPGEHLFLEPPEETVFLLAGIENFALDPQWFLPVQPTKRSATLQKNKKYIFAPFHWQVSVDESWQNPEVLRALFRPVLEHAQTSNRAEDA